MRICQGHCNCLTFLTYSRHIKGVYDKKVRAHEIDRFFFFIDRICTLYTVCLQSENSRFQGKQTSDMEKLLMHEKVILISF